jgi:hypothetical protein
LSFVFFSQANWIDNLEPKVHHNSISPPPHTSAFIICAANFNHFTMLRRARKRLHSADGTATQAKRNRATDSLESPDGGSFETYSPELRSSNGEVQPQGTTPDLEPSGGSSVETDSPEVRFPLPNGEVQSRGSIQDTEPPDDNFAGSSSPEVRHPQRVLDPLPEHELPPKNFSVRAKLEAVVAAQFRLFQDLPAQTATARLADHPQSDNRKAPMKWISPHPAYGAYPPGDFARYGPYLSTSPAVEDVVFPESHQNSGLGFLDPNEELDAARVHYQKRLPHV